MRVMGMGVPELVILLIFPLIFAGIGLICMSIAAKKGYSKVGFFFLGFFVGLIGLIIALCLPSRVGKSAEEVLAYKKLMDERVITSADFEAKRSELLSGNGQATSGIPKGCLISYLVLVVLFLALFLWMFTFTKVELFGFGL